MKLFLKDDGKKPKSAVQKPNLKAKAVAVDQLVVSLQGAVNEMSKTNKDLMDNVVMHLSRELPTPIIKMNAPDIKFPPFPEPDPGKQWRQITVTVKQRDVSGKIKIVDLERIK